MIPGARLSFPREIVRVCFGDIRRYEKDGKSGWTTGRNDYLFLGTLAKRKTIGGKAKQAPKTDAGEPKYRPNARLMELLAEQHKEANCQEHCCRGWSGDLADFKPLWVPIYVIGADPSWYWQEGLQADYGDKWVCRCEGPWTPKTDEDIDWDAKALVGRGLPTEIAKAIPFERRLSNVLLQKGTAYRREVTKAERGGYSVKLVGTPAPTECNPARCPNWWRREKRGQIVCEEIGTLTFLLPFLDGHEQWGLYRTRGRASCDSIRSGLAAAAALAGGNLTLVPLRLSLDVRDLLTPSGETQRQPVAMISPNLPAQQMAALIESRAKQRVDALTGTTYLGADGLPQLNPANVPPDHERAMLPEWQGAAPTDSRPWQSRLWEEASELGVPADLIGEWAKTSEDQAATALEDWRCKQGPQDRQQQPEGSGGEAEEEPIEAEFVAEEAEPDDLGLSGAMVAAREKGMSDEDILAAKNTAGLLKGEVTVEQVSAFSRQVARFRRKERVDA